MMSWPSWCLACACTALVEIVISTYVLVSEPVEWQIVILPAFAWGGGVSFDRVVVCPPDPRRRTFLPFEAPSFRPFGVGFSFERDSCACADPGLPWGPGPPFGIDSGLPG